MAVWKPHGFTCKSCNAFSTSSKEQLRRWQRLTLLDANFGATKQQIYRVQLRSRRTCLLPKDCLLKQTRDNNLTMKDWRLTMQNFCKNNWETYKKKQNSQHSDLSFFRSKKIHEENKETKKHRVFLDIDSPKSLSMSRCHDVLLRLRQELETKSNPLSLTESDVEKVRRGRANFNHSFFTSLRFSSSF